MASIERIGAFLDGIGHVIADRKLSVPIYQRAYAWTDEQVTELLKDLSDAIITRSEEYFLGTVVLTKGQAGRQMVIDGQQRLVTVTILIAAIKDYFEGEGDNDRASEIKKKYLSERTIRSLEETMPIRFIDKITIDR
jgi:uncharacterized protein with ParB-like and HNH nuclease domain